MARFAKLIAAAAFAATAAAPATAQYQQQYPQPYPQQGYPPQTYPQQDYPQQSYPQQGYGYDQQYGTNQNALGAIIDGLIGNRYNVSDRQAIHQCSWAAIQRARGGNWNGGGGYGQPYPGYNNYFGNSLRVTGITDVERRSKNVRVRGTMGSGRYGNQGYDPRYPNQPYGGGYGRSDLSFRCDVDYNGYVHNIHIEPLYRAY